VAGLYLAPPVNAAVFAVDEKPQIQALERTAPVLAMVTGTPERRSFDYVRPGTVRDEEGDREVVCPAPGGGLP
jgi:hypothetical protein